jgi:Fibronectin type III domain
LMAQSFSPTSPAKEYIYLGDRLLAVDSPPPANGPPSAPLSLVAAPANSTTVHLSWTAPSGTIDHYQIERRSTLSGAATILTTTGSGVSYDDTSLNPGSTYLYRVRSVDTYAQVSVYGNLDYATAFVFTDSPLTAGSTPIKAVHLTELRQAVNAVRLTAGLSASTWTDSTLSGVAVKKIHVQELRDSINQALQALGFSTPAFTDATLTAGTSVIKKLHIEELRLRVK